MRSGSAAPALVVQLYTEDKRDAGHECRTLKEVVLGMFLQLRPDLKTNHVECKPVHASPERRVSGSYWKVTGGAADPGAQARRITLIQDIVTALRRGHIVIFHVDGDEPWLKDGKHAAVWKHLERLQRDLERFVFEPSVGHAPLSREVELRHVFIPAVPFYSMESWAYANSKLLREILTEPGDLEFIERWEADPMRRDNEVQIKTTTLSIQDSLNEILVKRSRGFPAAALIELGMSYAATVKRLGESPVIAQGLASAAARPY